MGCLGMLLAGSTILSKGLYDGRLCMVACLCMRSVQFVSGISGWMLRMVRLGLLLWVVGVQIRVCCLVVERIMRGLTSLVMVGVGGFLATSVSFH